MRTSRRCTRSGQITAGRARGRPCSTRIDGTGGEEDTRRTALQYSLPGAADREPATEPGATEPQRAAIAPAPARPAFAPGGALSAARLLGLQRTAGNQAVSRLVLGRQTAAPAAAAAPVAPAPQAAQASGEPINVALYLPAELDTHASGEFRRQAETWARNHGAFGVREGRAQAGLAMRIDNRRPHETLRRVLEAVRESRGLPEGEEVPLAALAIFTHGTPRGLQTGRQSEGEGDQVWSHLNSLRPLLDIVADSLVAHGDVIFYACSAAGPVQVPGQTYQNLVQQAYDYLATHGAPADAEVWGHNTARHTTGNPDTASSSGVGREQLFDELAERSFADRGGTLNAQGSAEVIAQLAALWRPALQPRGDQAAMFALIEEIPLLGYDAFYRVVAGAESPDGALAVFPSYTRGDRTLFTRAVTLVRSRFDSAAADALVARALGRPAAPAAESPAGAPAAPAAGTGQPSPAPAQPGGGPPGAAVLTPARATRAVAYYRRRNYPGSLLRALRAAVGAPGASEPADEALVEAVARYQAAQSPPMSADGMAGPLTLARLGLDGQPAERRVAAGAEPDDTAAA